MEGARVRNTHGSRPVTPARSAARRTAVVLFALLLPPVAAALSIRALWPASPKAAAPTVSAHAEASPKEDLTPEIRGRILDADGNPVRSAAVRLVSPGPPYKVYRDATSDGAGSFSFAHLGPERVRVVADHDPEGFVSSAELQATTGRSEEVTLVLSPTSGVRGAVIDGEDHPVAGATLSVEGIPWRVPSATSDEGGTFRMIVVPDQAASLLAVARGYKAARVALGHRDERAELVVRVQLAAASPVKGDVQGTDGEPIAAQIVACAGQSAEERTTSVEDGSFELPPSTLGCEAVAELAGYAPSEPVVITDGRRLQLRLKTGGAIEGVVVDDHGSGVPSFKLGIEAYVSTRAGNVDRGPRSFEDVRGAFRWDKLAPGRYVLTASVPGKPPARSATIAVQGGDATRGVRIVIAQGGAVSGRVFDDHGAPVSGAEVGFDVVSSIVPGNAGAKTDGSGRYRLDGAPSGPFTLRAQKDGFRTRLVSALRVASGSTLAQDVTLTPAGEGANLELGGIGVGLMPTPEGIVMVAVGADDPAGRAGLEDGDRILGIDGESSEGMSFADVMQRLRGEPKTSVGVSVERPSSGQVLDVVIERGVIVR